MESDAELRRYRVDIHSLAVGFPEPATAQKMQKELFEDFGAEVPFRKFGYMSFGAFLDDHPDLQQVVINGVKCYRAKISAATADIQSLVSRQKKKTDNKRGRKGKKKNWSSPPQRPRMLPPPPLRPMRPQNYSPKVAQQAKSEPLTGTPAERAHRGKTRLMAALNRCLGTATLTKLNTAYQMLYGCQMNQKEMKDHFGTANFRMIHEQWLSDEMEMTSASNGDWIFVSKENLRKQREWEDKYKNMAVVTSERRIVWDKPTIKDLYEKVVAMLVNMYPTPLPINNVAEIYKRAHGVHVDPEELYSKNWEELVKTTFKEKMQLKEGEVTLTQKALQDHQKEISDRQKAAATASASNVLKRVTADDLGLEYSDESDDSEEDEDEEGGGGGDAASDISSIKFSPVVSLEDIGSNTTASGESSSIKDGNQKHMDFGQRRTCFEAFRGRSAACDTSISSIASSEKPGRVIRHTTVKLMSAAEFEAMKREREGQNKENNRNGGRNTKRDAFRPPSPRRNFTSRPASVAGSAPPTALPGGYLPPHLRQRNAQVAHLPPRGYVPPPERHPEPHYSHLPPRPVPAVEKSPRKSIFERISFVGNPDSSPRRNSFRNEKSPSISPKKNMVWASENARNQTNKREYRLDTRSVNQLLHRAKRESSTKNSTVKSSPPKSSPEKASPLKITVGEGDQGRRVSLESPVPKEDLNGNQPTPRFFFRRPRGSGFGAMPRDISEKETN